MLDPRAPDGLGRHAVAAGNLALLVGPEGGLAPAEREMAAGSGFVPVRLGPRTDVRIKGSFVEDAEGRSRDLGVEVD